MSGKYARFVGMEISLIDLLSEDSDGKPPSRSTELNQEAPISDGNDADLSSEHATTSPGWYVFGYRQDIGGCFALLSLSNGRFD